MNHNDKQKRTQPRPFRSGRPVQPDLLADPEQDVLADNVKALLLFEVYVQGRQ